MVKKVEIQKLIEQIEIIGGTIGVILILWGLYRLFGVDLKYLIFSLILAGIIGLIWRELLRRKLK